MSKRIGKNRIVQFTIILAIGILTHACVETEQISPIPAIKFENFSFFNIIEYSFDDSSQTTYLYGKLEFEFIDGDADLGSTESDSSSILRLIQYEKIDGVYHRITKGHKYYHSDSVKFIPHDYKMDRVGQNKTIKGIMRFDILFELIPEIDTMKYDFYITDRAKNESNLESTSDFSFNFEPQFP